MRMTISALAAAILLAGSAESGPRMRAVGGGLPGSAEALIERHSSRALGRFSAVPALSSLAWGETRLGNRPRGGQRVQLVCVVQDGGLRRPRAAQVVVDSDGVEQLGFRQGVQLRRAL